MRSVEDRHTSTQLNSPLSSLLTLEKQTTLHEIKTKSQDQFFLFVFKIGKQCKVLVKFIYHLRRGLDFKILPFDKRLLWGLPNFEWNGVKGKDAIVIGISLNKCR